MTRNTVLKTLPRSAGEVALVVTVFSLGTLVGAQVQPDPGDWLGFAGALIGAAVTVAGSVYVLDRERTRVAREQTELLVTLLDDVKTACEPFQVANNAALQARYGRNSKQQANELKSAVSRVHRFRDNIKPTTARMMRISDAIEKLEIDPDLDEAAKVSLFYPDSGDFGHLNGLAHEVATAADQIRKLVTD